MTPQRIQRMQLGHVTARLLRRAINIYLHYAYTNGTVPYTVRSRVDFPDSAPLGELLESDRFEISRSTGNGDSQRYLLRLGNDRYPHMKMGMASCSGDSSDYVFVVDTHDRHFRIDPDIPGADEIRELQHYNDHIKQEIERHWEAEGIPTQRMVLEDYTGASCRFDAASKTVLIVEDEEPIADLERHILECEGYTVIVSLSGAEAIRAAEKEHVDLCLLDIMMPDADGFDVIRTLKARHLKHFPIIFVTAMPEERVDKNLAEGFIAKPFEPQYLIEKIQKLLNRRRQGE